MHAIFLSSPLAARPRVLLTLGLSITLHAAVLGGWRPFDFTPPRISAFEPIEVSLIGQTAPRTGQAAVAATAPEAPPTPKTAHAQPGDGAGSGEPLVQARSDVASLDNPRPPYPLAARRAGLQGRVLLSVHVQASGGGTAVKLKESSGHALLDEAAQRTVSRWRFIPARRGGRSVDSWVDVPVSFRLESQARLAL